MDANRVLNPLSHNGNSNRQLFLKLLPREKAFLLFWCIVSPAYLLILSIWIQPRVNWIYSEKYPKISKKQNLNLAAYQLAEFGATSFASFHHLECASPISCWMLVDMSVSQPRWVSQGPYLVHLFLFLIFNTVPGNYQWLEEITSIIL